MIKRLNSREETLSNSKLNKEYLRLNNLIAELNKKGVPDEIIESINVDIDLVNNFKGPEDKLRKLIRKVTRKILILIEKKLKIVVKSHYQNLWMALGLSIFGVPFGIVWFAISGNPAFIAIGIPLGLPIGMAVGISMDKKAEKEGRQITID